MARRRRDFAISKWEWLSPNDANRREEKICAKSRARRKSTAAHFLGSAATYPASARYSASELEHIAERIFKLSEADETEVEIDSTVDALTRFANNTIHQNVAEHTLGNFRARRGGWPYGSRHDQQDRRRIAAARGCRRR